MLAACNAHRSSAGHQEARAPCNRLCRPKLNRCAQELLARHCQPAPEVALAALERSREWEQCKHSAVTSKSHLAHLKLSPLSPLRVACISGTSVATKAAASGHFRGYGVILQREPAEPSVLAAAAAAAAGAPAADAMPAAAKPFITFEALGTVARLVDEWTVGLGAPALMLYDTNTASRAVAAQQAGLRPAVRSQAARPLLHTLVLFLATHSLSSRTALPRRAGKTAQDHSGGQPTAGWC